MESDDDIFLTQNTFSANLSIDTTLAEDAANELLNIDPSVFNDFEEVKTGADESEKYQVDCSDISDEELVSTCEQAERNMRFGVPLKEEEVCKNTTKR